MLMEDMNWTIVYYNIYLMLMIIHYFMFQSYTKAITLNPNIGSAHLSLGVIYHLQVSQTVKTGNYTGLSNPT